MPFQFQSGWIRAFPTQILTGLTSVVLPISGGGFDAYQITASGTFSAAAGAYEVDFQFSVDGGVTFINTPTYSLHLEQSSIASVNYTAVKAQNVAGGSILVGAKVSTPWFFNAFLYVPNPPFVTAVKYPLNIKGHLVDSVANVDLSLSGMAVWQNNTGVGATHIKLSIFPANPLQDGYCNLAGLLP